MEDDDLLAGWAVVVDKVIRGDKLRRQFISLGPTPQVLIQHGLCNGGLRMTVAKLAACRKAHPEVPLDVLRQLPELLADPLAVFPSARRDGSIVTLLIVRDRNGKPIVVAVNPDHATGHNIVLSVYGKDAGDAWIDAEIQAALHEGLVVYVKNGFAASLPQPQTAEAASSSHGLIPSDGTAKPKRDILSTREKFKLKLNYSRRHAQITAPAG